MAPSTSFPPNTPIASESALADPVPFDDLLTRLIADRRNIDLLWQVGVLAVCALAAWGAMPLLKPHFEKTTPLRSAGIAGAGRVAFPLLILLASSTVGGIEITFPQRVVHLASPVSTSANNP